MFGFYIAGAVMVLIGQIAILSVKMPRTQRVSATLISMFYLFLLIFGAIKF